MDGEDGRRTQAQDADAGPEAPGWPRSANLAAVAGAVILIGLVAFALYRRSQSAVPAASGEPAPEAPAREGDPSTGTAITAVVPVKLSPEASIVAERYRCVCGCNDPLSVCTCTESPGSRDMKTYLQALVDQKKTVGEIDAAMVGTFGAPALLSHPSPGPRRPHPGP